jgi:hypothetical protein
MHGSLPVTGQFWAETGKATHTTKSMEIRTDLIVYMFDFAKDRYSSGLGLKEIS